MTENSWHLEKKVSIGHLTTTIMIAVSAMFYIQKMDQRISLLEQRVQIEVERAEKAELEIAERVRRTRQESKEERKQMAGDMRAGFDKINTKLDRMMEKVTESNTKKVKI